mmetsp:Transcript_17228/g.57059  ORF Transcript_17228/g.57059 Transcript_17228/m.57059 type:complete len:133 (-) Transcript_17228:919-1317(-)
MKKARQALVGHGLSPDPFEQLWQQTREKFPTRLEPIPPTLLDAVGSSRQMLSAQLDDAIADEPASLLDKILDQREVGKFLRRFTASSAPDQFGWRPFQHLILKPIALGIPSGAFLEEYTRGGRFIPGAKDCV